MIGSEAVPFSKTGGLADVLGALPIALARLGWRVTLVVPRYRGTSAGTLVGRYPITVGGYHADVGFFEAPLADGARAILIDEPGLYDREGLYGTAQGEYADNARRFAMLVRAAFEFAAREGERPTVVHAHDWQAGLAPVYLKSFYADTRSCAARRASSRFTTWRIRACSSRTGCRASICRGTCWDSIGMEFWGKISFLKGGSERRGRHHDRQSSSTRAKFRRRSTAAGWKACCSGAPAISWAFSTGSTSTSGIPRAIAYLPMPFSIDDLAGKRAAKVAVLARYGLPHEGAAVERPLIGMISRMVAQKGLDLIAGLEDQLPLLGASFVVLGTGDAHYQDFWRRLAARYPDRIGVQVGFDESLAHLIEAGSDIFLMPSRFEPCGLNQMYSLRYGTIPLVRKVGGLADTVVDYQPGTAGGNGFVFEDYSPAALLGTLQRALDIYRDAAAWRALQAPGMASDHSWDRSAREYVRIYGRAVTKGELNGSG